MSIKQTITFIGAGNMAKAMIGGILANHLCEEKEITATNSSAASCQKNKEAFCHSRWPYQYGKNI